jgi:glucokinase
MLLGIEIGGTKLQLGLGLGKGRVVELWRGPVDVTAGAEGIRAQIRLAIPQLLNQARIRPEELKAIGVGFGGPVDDSTRRVITSHQIHGWDDFPLADWLEGLCSVPAFIGNDADVAGLAEAIFGAGAGLSPMFYITVGTGIGGGYILDQKIIRGCGRGAAEIGHLRIARSDGSVVPLELIASGWGIEALARAEGQTWTAPEVARRAAIGEPAASQILTTALAALAEGICHVIALTCPRRIVIGGGVSLMGEELFFRPLRQMIAERQFRPFLGLTTLAPAALGEEVVVQGALALARQQLAE